MMDLDFVLGKPHEAMPHDWHERVRGQTLAVTGAGGFIASHLTELLSAAEPARILLVERSEFALYEAHRRLEGLYPEIKFVPVLGSYGGRGALKALRTFKPSQVVHAGAYKHVPLVERNPVQGVQNNVLEAIPLFELCAELGVGLTVVSSDKAVRPTNVMGASKTLVEYAALQIGPKDTRVVRFGNVMWSSGSVLPLFQEQLLAGNPVTLTDPEVSRYFMTVGQAATLMCHTLKMVGRRVLALDMGAPVLIREVAEKLAVHLGTNPPVFRITGLRPGEKLHEELTLGDQLQPTDNPQIMEALEPAPEEVYKMVADLELAIESEDPAELRRVLKKYVKGYRPSCGIVDDSWLEAFVNRGRNSLDDCFQPTRPSA